MRTEITIPFAFDTAPIEAMLQEHGTEEAMKVIERMVRESVISQVPKQENPWGYVDKEGKPDWKRYLDTRFDLWLDEHKEEIIDEAALLLAMKAGRKGRWRDVLREMKEEQA